MKGMFKVVLLGLERQLNARIPLDHPIISWLLMHGAMLRTLLVRGDDGMTAHQRARGASGNLRLLSFGEMCRYKCRAQEGGIAGTKWRFSTGIWLGIDRRTGQYVIYDQAMGGIRHARTLIPMPRPQKWSAEAVQAVAATPWSLHQSAKPEVIRLDNSGLEPEERHDKVPMVRRFYIRQKDLDTHGYTKNCPKCQHLITRTNHVENSTPHSLECRKRIETELAKTAEGRARLHRVEEKTQKWLEGYVERTDDTKHPAAAQGGQEAAASGAPRQSATPHQHLRSFPL
jgi:hypothetical protein